MIWGEKTRSGCSASSARIRNSDGVSWTLLAVDRHLVPVEVDGQAADPGDRRPPRAVEVAPAEDRPHRLVSSAIENGFVT